MAKNLAIDIEGHSFPSYLLYTKTCQPGTKSCPEIIKVAHRFIKTLYSSNLDKCQFNFNSLK